MTIPDVSKKVYCPNIHDNDRMDLSFGLSIPKKEGSPIDPDMLDWEHPPGSGCEKCQKRYEKQLKVYNDYYNDNSSSI